MVLIEGCVTSLPEAKEVAGAGADRVELCRELEAGGLTPSNHVVGQVLQGILIPVYPMVRPRAGGFRMDPTEITTMLRTVEDLAGAGVHGFVLGMLDRTGSIDRTPLNELVDAASGRPVTFHRAFDEVADPLPALEVLIEAGVARVLTAGQARTAWEGRGLLREMVQVADGRMTILGGGTIRGDHVQRLVESTGLQEVHARASAVAGVVDALSRKTGR